MPTDLLSRVSNLATTAVQAGDVYADRPLAEALGEMSQELFEALTVDVTGTRYTGSDRGADIDSFLLEVRQSGLGPRLVEALARLSKSGSVAWDPEPLRTLLSELEPKGFLEGADIRRLAKELGRAPVDTLDELTGKVVGNYYLHNNSVDRAFEFVETVNANGQVGDLRRALNAVAPKMHSGA